MLINPVTLHLLPLYEFDLIMPKPFELIIFHVIIFSSLLKEFKAVMFPKITNSMIVWTMDYYMLLRMYICI